MTAIKPITIDLEAENEHVFFLTAIPVTKLQLAFAGSKLAGPKLEVKLSGSAQNLPAGTPVEVDWQISQNGKTRTFAGGSAELAVNGGSASLTLLIDLLEARLVGEDKLGISLKPRFPCADDVVLAPSLAFDYPLKVTMSPAHEGTPALVGEKIELSVDAHPVFAKAHLRLTIQEMDEGKAEVADANDLATEIVWKGDLDQGRTYRVGCTSPEGSPVFDYLEPSEQGDYELGFSLSASFDEGKTFFPVSGQPAQIVVTRPKLASFAIVKDEDVSRMFTSADPWEFFCRWFKDKSKEYRAIKAQGKITGFAPGLHLEMEAALWGYSVYDEDVAWSPIVMDPLTGPKKVTVAEDGTFTCVLLDMVSIKNEAELARYVNLSFFAVLRVPPALTGGRSFAPFYQVMDYDEATFAPMGDEDMPMALGGTPPKGGNKYRSKKEMGTGVCSSDIAGIKLVRLPAFGKFAALARKEDIVFACTVRGDVRYWDAAAPSFTVEAYNEATKIYDKVGDFKAARSASDPRIFEIAFPMTDKRVKGKQLRLTAKVTKPDAKMDGTTSVAAPKEAKLWHVGKPTLSGLTREIVEENGEKTWRLSCRASHFPTTKSLSFVVGELFEGIEQPIVSSRIKIAYDLPAKEDGQCDESGWFSARIVDKDSLEWLEGGKFRIEVKRRQEDGKVLGEVVAPLSIEVGDKRRSVAGKVIFGTKVSVEFRKKVIAYCRLLQIDHNWLMACMALETGETFSPSIRNPDSGAVGLIQFTKPAATTVGTTKEALGAMTAEAQLEYVYKYFEPVIGKLSSIEDVYAQIFCPAAVGKPNDHVLYSTASGAAYSQNSGLDSNKDGKITKEEAGARVREKYDIGLQYIADAG